MPHLTNPSEIVALHDHTYSHELISYEKHEEKSSTRARKSGAPKRPHSPLLLWFLLPLLSFRTRKIRAKSRVSLIIVDGVVGPSVVSTSATGVFM
mmetsp:Transcript_37253/g.78562  ORF Transcript_37253/g.78562 Transcript_37253/m.78562 type:complete len:95 (+) Transcript_37253:326-610(+)